MALAKTIATQFGVDSNYWNIGAINQDYKNKIIEVVMYGYISKANRDSNANPIVSKNITLNAENYVLDATRELLYPILKQKDFVGATDC